MNTYFSSNLKLLRKRKESSQDDLAKAVGLKRHDNDNYERGIVPPPENMIALADFFGMSVDTLLRIDMSKISEFNLSQLEQGYDTYVKGTKLRVHATTVDIKGNENVELVAHKAKAGYTTGYSDPEFVSGLPTFQLPFLSRERKYRMFQIDGDSMLPIPDKSFVIGELLQNWNEIKNGNAYVFLMRDEGIVFKVAYNQLRKKKNLLLKSLNSLYEPYEINMQDILEVWSFINYFSSELPDPLLQNKHIIEKVDELRNMITNQV